MGMPYMSVAAARRAKVALVLGVIGTLMVAGPVVAAAPSNDLITNPQIISLGSLSGVSSATNVDATFGGEPTPSCRPGVGKSVWWRIRTEQPTVVSMSTIGPGTTFDTVLAAYKSTSNGLAQVACNDDTAGTLQSAISFTAAAQAVYYIQISGHLGASGNIQFNHSLIAVNDAFAKAQTIRPGFNAFFSSAFTNAGRQTNEPTGCNNIGHTLWYRFKSSATRRLSFDTFDSNFDSQVAVYRGTSLGGLVQVTCADDTDAPDGDASVSWTAQANKTYYIQVGGYNDAFGMLKVNFVRLP